MMDLKTLSLASSIFLSSLVFAESPVEKQIRLELAGKTLTEVIDQYADQTNSVFIYDSSVESGSHSKLLFEGSWELSEKEAYHQLSLLLAKQGYAIIQMDDTHHIARPREIKGRFIEVMTDVPAMKPERLVTWVYSIKKIGKNKDAVDRLRNLLIAQISKSGEIQSLTDPGVIVITDWSSSINHVAQILHQIDR